MSDTGPTPATFCYQCGKRVGKQTETCWFCGAPTRRWIRRPKHCQFCGEPVRAEAVKCRHCGEFLDGRPRPEAAVQRQIVFVVDRNLIPGMQVSSDFRLVGGEPVPPQFARALDAQTVRAIESGQPALIAQAGVRALPAPAPGEPLDVEPLGPASSSARALPAPGGHDPANLPALRPAGAPARAESGGLGKALVKAGGALVRRALAPAPKKPQPAPAAGPQDQYRYCIKCQTEILASDNFCFNCAAQYHEAKIEILPLEIRGRNRLNVGQILFSLTLIAVYAELKLNFIPLPFEVPQQAIAAPAVAGAAVLVSVLGALLGRGFLNKFLSLALAALAAAAWFIL